MTNPPADVRLRRAFFDSFDPQGKVAAVFAAELQEALPWMTGKAAEESVSDILARRRAEQQMISGATPVKLDEHGLPEGKEQELVESLAQPRQGESSGSADALVHIYANIRAQRELHAALASHVFRPGGAFEQTLAAALKGAAPDLSESEIAGSSADFVRLRRERAQGIADALRPGGTVEQQAVKLATRLRRESDTLAHSTAKNVKQSQGQLGEDIAFGLQQTLACWATDFIDPYVGKWFQDKFRSDHHHGTLAHTWGGEIIGDTAAFFAFLGVRQFMPQSVDWLKSAALHMGDGFYEKTGKKSLASWAKMHHVDEKSDAYRKKLQEWKDFQADNFAKASVISASSVVLNVATQKALGNTHTLPVITASKLVGAAITMASMLGLRFLIPKTTKELDDELSDKYFNPVIRKTQRLFGATTDDPRIDESRDHDKGERGGPAVGQHTAKLTADPSKGSLGWNKN